MNSLKSAITSSLINVPVNGSCNNACKCKPQRYHIHTYIYTNICWQMSGLQVGNPILGHRILCHCPGVLKELWVNIKSSGKPPIFSWLKIGGGGKGLIPEKIETEGGKSGYWTKHCCQIILKPLGSLHRIHTQLYSLACIWILVPTIAC